MAGFILRFQQTTLSTTKPASLQILRKVLSRTGKVERNAPPASRRYDPAINEPAAILRNMSARLAQTFLNVGDKASPLIPSHRLEEGEIPIRKLVERGLEHSRTQIQHGRSSALLNIFRSDG